MDKKIATYKNPTKEIDKLVKKYKSDLVWIYSSMKIDTINTYCNMINNYLNDYNVRLYQVNNDYKLYMSDYIIKTKVVN